MATRVYTGTILEVLEYNSASFYYFLNWFGHFCKVFQVSWMTCLLRKEANHVALWLKFWSDTINRGEEKTGLYLGVYAALQIAGVCWFSILIWYE